MFRATFPATLTATVLLLAGCPEGGPGDQPVDAAPDSARPDAGPTDGRVDARSDAQEQDAGPPTVQSMDATTLRYDEVPTLKDRGGSIIDVRPGEDFQAGHIPTAESLPARDVWDGSSFRDGGAGLRNLAPVQDLRLVFYGSADQADTVQAMAEAALEMGYTDVHVLEGGIEAWRALGFYEDIDIDGLLALHYDPIPAGEFIVDTMDATSYAEGHIPGAVHVDAEWVWDADTGELIDGGSALTNVVGCDPTAIIVYCVNMCHASTVVAQAAEQIECLNGTRILHFPGGMDAWRAAGQPMACGTDPNGPCN